MSNDSFMIPMLLIKYCLDCRDHSCLGNKDIFSCCKIGWKLMEISLSVEVVVEATGETGAF